MLAVITASGIWAALGLAGIFYGLPLAWWWIEKRRSWAKAHDEARRNGQDPFLATLATHHDEEVKP